MTEQIVRTSWIYLLNKSDLEYILNCYQLKTDGSIDVLRKRIREFVTIFKDTGEKLQNVFKTFAEKKSNPEQIEKIIEFLQNERKQYQGTKFWKKFITNTNQQYRDLLYERTLDPLSEEEEENENLDLEIEREKLERKEMKSLEKIN